MKGFNEIPIVGILRGITEKHIEELTHSIISSGLKTVEITMNTKNATRLIKLMKNYTGNKLSVGAGTVLNLSELHEALNAGAEFIVTPSVVEEVIGYCKTNRIPVFPGALTPTEIHNAWQLGATMVKVFPASLFGPKYFRELKGPFDNIQLMAVGGVSDETITDFFKMGASAVAFGASIFTKENLENQNFSKIEENIKSLIEKYRIYRNEAS
jgi:2-dehydro-3-deoxyphosphogluconate aldolase / (4S)-4-hydroxy-2-oxoglutarate aldolase